MYQIEQKLEGRWWRIGRPFPTRQEADHKVLQYAEQGQQFGSKKYPILKQPEFRIRFVR